VLLQRLRPELLQRLGLVQHGGELPEAAVPGRVQFEHHWWSHADLVPSAGGTAGEGAAGAEPDRSGMPSVFRIGGRVLLGVPRLHGLHVRRAFGEARGEPQVLRAGDRLSGLP